jgi:hypothetical protein
MTTGRFAVWIAVCAVGLPLDATATRAQQTATSHVAVPVIASRPDDVGSIEGIVKADYESISGGVGVARQWARDLTLYDPNARSFDVATDPKTHAVTKWTPTFQEYTDATDASFVKSGFSEHEVAHTTYRFGHVATVFSSYVGTLASTGKPTASGVNIYQLYFDGKRWWISSVSWDGNLDPSAIPTELRAQ